MGSFTHHTSWLGKQRTNRGSTGQYIIASAIQQVRSSPIAPLYASFFAMSKKVIVNKASRRHRTVVHPPEQHQGLVGRLSGPSPGTSLEDSQLNTGLAIVWESEGSTGHNLGSSNPTETLGEHNCSSAYLSACLDANAVDPPPDEASLPSAVLHSATEVPKMPPPAPHNAAMLPSLQSSQPRATGEREYR